MTNCIIYTRFSPRPNAAECDSCEMQRRICEEYAKKRGWTVAQVIDDPDVSGSEECRPKLIDAVNALDKGDVLLVYCFDRIARNAYLFETIRRKVEQRKAQLAAVRGDVDCADEGIRTLVRQILAAVAEYERKIISRRTSDLAKARMRDGLAVNKNPPYGWKIDPDNDKRVIEDEREQAVIANIRLYHASGLSLRGIIAKLDSSTARSGKWNACQIKRILDRPASNE